MTIIMCQQKPKNKFNTTLNLNKFKINLILHDTLLNPSGMNPVEQ